MNWVFVVMNGNATHSMPHPENQRSRCRGFKFEGRFSTRYEMYQVDRNRDTSWFSIMDKDWPNLKTAFQSWLNPENFDTGWSTKIKSNRN